ncbi:hypothetical protein FOZ62_019906, partial [Perkinsus olseni]
LLVHPDRDISINGGTWGLLAACYAVPGEAIGMDNHYGRCSLPDRHVGILVVIGNSNRKISAAFCFSLMHELARYFVHEVNNWMLLVGAGITIIACIFLFRSINRACKVISVAAYGLRKTPWVIITSLMVKAIYVLYVVLWTIFMIRSAQAKSVKMSNCTLEDEKWIQ